MLAKTGSYILKNLRPKFPSPLRCMPAFRFWMEPQVSNELQGRPSHPPGRHSRLTGPHRLSQRCSEHLVDLSAPLDPFEEVDNVLRKLRLCGVLASKVLKTLGLGWVWMAMLARLLLYSTLLSPGFILMGLFYFFSNRVHRNIWYGRMPRNLLDLYIPYRHWLRLGPSPVVVFVTGGAWTIGYKAWGALFARRLSQLGIIVVSIDYRNFPQGSVVDMVEDVGNGIAWVLDNIEQYGGDPQQLYVMGQSCGGHLAMLAMLEQCRIWAAMGQNSTTPESSIESGCESEEQPDAVFKALPFLPTDKWSSGDIKALITLSTPFDIASLQTHFRERGMPKDMLNGIFCPETTPGSETPSFTRTSPYEQVKASSSDLKSYLPPVLLLHGQKDKTVPYSEATQMCEALRSQGVEATCKLYKDETHTTPLLEGPFAGKQDFAMHDVLDLILGSKAASLRRPSIEPWPLLPFPNIATCLATFVCPF